MTKPIQVGYISGYLITKIEQFENRGFFCKELVAQETDDASLIDAILMIDVIILSYGR